MDGIDGAHPEGACEIVPMRQTDELHRRLAQDQFVDSTSKVLGSIMMSVSFSNKVKSLKLKHHDINRAYFQEQLRDTLTSDFHRRLSEARTT